MREWTRAVAIVVAVLESRVSDAAKIVNMVTTGAEEGSNLFGERQCRVKYETEIFSRQAWHYMFGGREEERGLTIFQVC